MSKSTDPKEATLKEIIGLQKLFKVGTREWHIIGGLWNGMHDLRRQIRELKAKLGNEHGT